MRTLRTMPSSAMLRLFITDCRACAFRFAPMGERRAPTATTITTANSATATIISTRVNPVDSWELLVDGERERRNFWAFFSQLSTINCQLFFILIVCDSLIHRYLTVVGHGDGHGFSTRRQEHDTRARLAGSGRIQGMIALDAVRGDKCIGLGTPE